MKKFFLLLFIMLPALLLSQSKTKEILDREGTLLTKQFVELGTIANTKFELMKVTDMLTDSISTAVKMTTKYYSIDKGEMLYSDGVIDEDEIEKVKKVFSVIYELMSTPAPDEHPEILFSTRDGVLIKAYLDKYISGPNVGKSLWTVEIYTNKDNNNSKLGMQKIEALGKIIDIFDKI